MISKCIFVTLMKNGDLEFKCGYSTMMFRLWL